MHILDEDGSQGVAVGALPGSEPVTMARNLRQTGAQVVMLREFRTATRFTRPGTDATLAVRHLAAGTASAGEATATVRKDLLDAYQARLRELLDEAARGEQDKLPVRRAEAAAQAAGYFEILARALSPGEGCAGAARGAC